MGRRYAEGPKRLILGVTGGPGDYRFDLACGHVVVRSVYRERTFGKRMVAMSCFWCSSEGELRLRQYHRFDDLR